MRFVIRKMMLLCAVFGLSEAAFCDWTNDFTFAATATAEYDTSYLSRGAVADDRGLGVLKGSISATHADFGTFGFFTWNGSSLSDRRSEVYRRAFHETHLRPFHAYCWHFNDDWRLRVEHGLNWYIAPGYRNEYKGVKDHSRLEFRHSADLSNPFLTPYYLVRYTRHPIPWVCVLAGVKHPFDLGHGVVFTPAGFAEGGNDRHFKNRYGDPLDGGDYDGYIQALNAELRLDWHITQHLTLYAAVRQFGIVDSEARDKVKAGNEPRNRRDLTCGTFGLTISF